MGEGRAERKWVRRTRVPGKSRQLCGGSGGSRSVRKWSFNGLPSPRQICHLSRLRGSPRAFHLLITSFQPAPSVPCLVPISSSAPGPDAPQAPRPIFQRQRPRPEFRTEQAQDPGLRPPTEGPACLPLPAPQPLPTRAGLCFGEQGEAARPCDPPPKGNRGGLEGHPRLFFITHCTFWFTNISVYGLHYNFVFSFFSFQLIFIAT